MSEELITADKMFEELGYEKREKQFGIYYDNNGSTIAFNKILKAVISIDCFDQSLYLGMNELHDINEKCKELGWI